MAITLKTILVYCEGGLNIGIKFFHDQHYNILSCDSTKDGSTYNYSKVYATFIPNLKLS